MSTITWFDKISYCALTIGEERLSTKIYDMELIGIASGTFGWIKRAEKALEFVDNVSLVSFADSFEIQRDKNVNGIGRII